MFSFTMTSAMAKVGLLFFINSYNSLRTLNFSANFKTYLLFAWPHTAVCRFKDRTSIQTPDN